MDGVVDGGPEPCELGWSSRRSRTGPPRGWPRRSGRRATETGTKGRARQVQGGRGEALDGRDEVVGRGRCLVPALEGYKTATEKCGCPEETRPGRIPYRGPVESGQGESAGGDYTLIKVVFYRVQEFPTSCDDPCAERGISSLRGTVRVPVPSGGSRVPGTPEPQRDGFVSGPLGDPGSEVPLLTRRTHEECQ